MPRVCLRFVPKVLKMTILKSLSALGAMLLFLPAILSCASQSSSARNSEERVASESTVDEETILPPPSPEAHEEADYKSHHMEEENGSSTCESRLTSRDLRDKVREQSTYIQRCFHEIQPIFMDPSVSYVEVKITIEIQADGSVSVTQVDKENTEDRFFSNCVAQRIETIQFDMPPNADSCPSITVGIPFNFSWGSS